MYINCTDKELQILKKIALAAKEQHVPCWLVGGFVRDKILGRPTKDMDIVCVGDGIVLAEKVAQQFNPKPEANIFKTFGTAQIKIKFNSAEEIEKSNQQSDSLTPVPSLKERGWGEALEIEFVGARKESYSFDSRKPAVELGNLEDDQNRRDFTINAMAISLNASDFGELVELLRNFFRQPNSIPYTNDIHVFCRPAQYLIPHKSANKVAGHLHSFCRGCDLF